MGRRWVDVSCIIARGPSAVFVTECMVEYRPAATVSAVKTRRVVSSSGIAPRGAVMVPAVIDLTSFSVHCSCVACEKFPPVLGRYHMWNKGHGTPTCRV